MKRDLPEAEVLQRAYSTFEVKNVDEDKRELEGWATTPTTDRMGDVVEPDGAEFKLPIPLLWQHNSREPIGHVVAAKVSKDGIFVRAKLAKISEPGKLKDRLDEAWQSIKIGLVRAFSIGFRSLEDSNIKDSFGLRFIRWEMLELSTVTIPANAEATITAIKSADENARAALGAQRKDVTTSRTTSPGASGKTVVRIKKDPEMKTYKEQIADLEATRAAKAARLQEIQKTVSESGLTKDEAQREEFDTLKNEIAAVDVELKDLRDLEKLNAASSEPVDGEKAKSKPAHGDGARVKINAKLEPGVKFARMALSLARAKYLQKEGRFMAPDQIYRLDKRWMDTAPEVELALKAAVHAGDSTTAGWASELAYAQNIASEFIEFLRPKTLIGRIPGWRNVPFNVRVGGQATGSTGYWAGQGVGINVSSASTTSVSLGITKVAGLVVITKELAMLSSPSAEAMVRNDLVAELQETADSALIDPNNGGETNIKPQSLTYGATARLASGTDYAAFKADWKAITANFFANNISLDGSVIVMKEELAQALSLMVTSLGNPQFPGLTPTGGTLMGYPVFTTQTADTSGSPDFDNVLILIQPREVFLADDGGASVEASDQVSVHMDNATTMKSTSTATSTSVVSMFQTESIAIKGVRHINWTKARSAACQYIRGAAYV